MATVALKTFSFTLTLADSGVDAVKLTDGLFGAGVNDCVPGVSAGRGEVHFDREARSLGDAVGSAIANVEQAGFAVSKIVVEAEDAA